MKAILLGQKIDQAMKDQRLSRVAFANMMSVQPSIITRWLSGKHNFTIETLFQIEASLNINLIAIETPDLKSMVFNMHVNSEHAVFPDDKEFPGFTSTNLREDQIERQWNDSQELSEYLLQLKKEI